MLNVFLSVLPIFLLILAGYVAKNYFVPEDGFWKTADKLVYYVFFPSLLLLDVSGANFASANTSSSILATVGGTVLVAIFIFVGQRVVTVRNDLFTPIFQGACVELQTTLFYPSPAACRHAAGLHERRARPPRF
jgi:predicted permease